MQFAVNLPYVVTVHVQADNANEAVEIAYERELVVIAEERDEEGEVVEFLTVDSISAAEISVYNLDEQKFEIVEM